MLLLLFSSFILVNAQTWPSKFLIKALHKNNLCVDDYGFEVKLNTCDPNNPNQQWTYDANTKLIKNANKNKCLDDGGATYGGQTKFAIWDCQSTNQNQLFTYDSFTKMFKNSVKNNLCMDDAGATTPGSARMHVWGCDANNGNQKFDIVSLALSNSVAPVALTPSNGFPSQFLFKIANSNLCVEETSSGGSIFNTCDQNNPKQQLSYVCRLYSAIKEFSRKMLTC